VDQPDVVDRRIVTSTSEAHIEFATEVALLAGAIHPRPCSRHLDSVGTGKTRQHVGLGRSGLPGRSRQRRAPGFGATRTGLPSLRGVVHVHGADKAPFVVTDSAQASAIAHTVAAAIKAARDKWRLTGTTHLFLAGPAGLAFLLGQLSNTLRPIQTYEFDYEDEGGCYPRSSAG
jgi:hypothetical protein